MTLAAASERANVLREKEEVERPGSEHDRDADTDVHAEARLFLAGDSAPVHQIAINAIESETGHLRHLFFPQREDRFAVKSQLLEMALRGQI